MNEPLAAWPRQRTGTVDSIGGTGHILALVRGKKKYDIGYFFRSSEASHRNFCDREIFPQKVGAYRTWAYTIDSYAVSCVSYRHRFGEHDDCGLRGAVYAKIRLGHQSELRGNINYGSLRL